MSKRVVPKHETCPMLARSDWGVGQIQSKGLTHALSSGQSPVGFHGPRVAGWLIFLNGCHRGEDLRLPIGETRIGSSWNNDYVLTGVGVGSQHGLIKMSVGEGFIQAAAVDRVIKVNNEVVTGSQKLEDGCLISIGELHGILRFSDRMGRGYTPAESPKPQSIATQAIHREQVCGWMIMTRGSLLGQDFRLTNGHVRIGSSLGLQISIPDIHLADHALTLSISSKECRVSWINDKHKLLVNGIECGTDTVLKESDLLTLDHLEAYIKWFRA